MQTWPSWCYYVIISPYWRFNSYSFSCPQLTVSKSIWWKIPKLNTFFCFKLCDASKGWNVTPSRSVQIYHTWDVMDPWLIHPSVYSIHSSHSSRSTSMALQYLCPSNIITMPKSPTALCPVLLTLYHRIRGTCRTKCNTLKQESRVNIHLTVLCDYNFCICSFIVNLSLCLTWKLSFITDV